MDAPNVHGKTLCRGIGPAPSPAPYCEICGAPLLDAALCRRCNRSAG